MIWSNLIRTNPESPRFEACKVSLLRTANNAVPPPMLVVLLKAESLGKKVTFPQDGLGVLIRLDLNRIMSSKIN